MLLDILKAIVGLGGKSAAATVTGVVNWGVLAPMIVYAYHHRDDMLDFRLSVGALCLIGAGVLVYLEILRRLNPSKEI